MAAADADSAAESSYGAMYTCGGEQRRCSRFVHNYAFPPHLQAWDEAEDCANVVEECVKWHEEGRLGAVKPGIQEKKKGGTVVEIEDHVNIIFDPTMEKMPSNLADKFLFKVLKGGKKTLKDLSRKMRVAASQLRPHEQKLKELVKTKQSLESRSAMALRQMASGALERSEAPAEAYKAVAWGAVNDEETMLAAATYNATPEDITALFEAARDAVEVAEEWVCSPAAAKLVAKDLLGMCPGGKMHSDEAQLKAKGLSKCDCEYCSCKEKASQLSPEIGRLRAEIAEHKEQIAWCDEQRRTLRGLIRRLRVVDPGSDEEDDGRNDPVFISDDAAPNDNAEWTLQVARAQTEWVKLESSLVVSDFPLRIVFLDKSGSMGFDQVTHDILKLGFQNSLNPQSGSVLLFLLSAPGETQILFRRPGDPSVDMTINLGSATWFNEPIVRTLTFLAGRIEQLDCEAFCKAHGQPPLQVLCLTDGADNMSTNALRNFSGLLTALKAIRGPVTSRLMYNPLVGPLEPGDIQGKVPVWLCWVACGMGGQQILNQSSGAKGITFIDAVVAPSCDALEPPAAISAAAAPGGGGSRDSDKDDEMRVRKSTAATRARMRGTRSRSLAVDGQTNASVVSSGWKVGHRVQLRPGVPGQAPKAAVILRVRGGEDGAPAEYDVVMDNENELTVDASRFVGAPPSSDSMLSLKEGQKPKGPAPQSGLLARTAEPEQQRLQALALVDAVTKDLSAVIKEHKQLISLEESVRNVTGGTEEISAEMAASIYGTLQEASAAVDITQMASVMQVDEAQLSQLFKEALQVVGQVSARMLPEDRLVAQSVLSVGLELLTWGGSVVATQVMDQLGQFAGVADANSKRRIPIDGDQLEAWYAQLSRPLVELMEFLLRKGLLESRQTPDSELRSCPEDARPAIAALWRFFDPSLSRSGVLAAEDSIRRSVNRFQRLRPAYSFASDQRSSSRRTTRGASSRSPIGRSSAASPALGREQVMAAFSAGDTDANGYLDRQEFVDVLMKLPGQWTREAIDTVIAAADADHEGRINLQEFMDYLFSDGDGSRSSPAAAASGQPSPPPLAHGAPRPPSPGDAAAIRAGAGRSRRASPKRGGSPAAAARHDSRVSGSMSSLELRLPPMTGSR